jgi:hypothetical protein
MKNLCIVTIYNTTSQSKPQNLLNLILRDEEYAVMFWKEVLYEYFYQVQYKLTLKKSDIIKAFTIHNRKPSGLSNIMVILCLYLNSSNTVSITKEQSIS